jgi:hypothetical protein
MPDPNSSKANHPPKLLLLMQCAKKTRHSNAYCSPPARNFILGQLAVLSSHQSWIMVNSQDKSHPVSALRTCCFIYDGLFV